MISELDSAEFDAGLRGRCDDALMHGYALALRLEGRRRRLRERQLELAGLSEIDDGMTRELASAAGREASLAREERRLRGLLTLLRERVQAASR